MAFELRLGEQIAYYRARAGEYDDWFFRRGRYDRGPEHKRAWFDAVAEVEAALDTFAPTGRVLELACGTGLWTILLVRHAAEVVAVDASPEVVEINRMRLGGQAAKVAFQQADLFAWTPPAHAFDVVFFSFWLSHVPEERFDEFWAVVRSALAPGGRAFFVDSLPDPDGTARDHVLEHSGEVTRRLDDGREFRIVKVFHRPDELQTRLEALGFEARVRSAGSAFLYGTASVRQDGPAQGD